MGAFKRLMKTWSGESQSAISTDPALIREVKGPMSLSRGGGQADTEVDERHPTGKMPLASDITEMCHRCMQHIRGFRTVPACLGHDCLQDELLPLAIFRPLLPSVRIVEQQVRHGRIISDSVSRPSMRRKALLVGLAMS